MKRERAWETISVEYAYQAQTPDQISLRADLVRFPSGRVGTYVYAEYPFEVCFILPILEDGRIVFIRQHRYPLNEELIEIPAGSPQGDETLTDCAIRETEEETGLRPTQVTHVLDFYPSPGSADMKAHLFLARGLVESGAKPDPDEQTEVVLLEPSRAMEMLRQGTIQHVGAVLGLLLLERPDLKQFGPGAAGPQTPHDNDKTTPTA